jgi:hypothetical protein
VPRTVMTTRAVPLVGGWQARIRVELEGEASVDVLELINPMGATQIVAADTALDEIAASLPISSAALASLLAARACPETHHAFVDPEPPTLPAGGPATRLHAAAVHYVDTLSTADVKGTCSGRLACAWAVNYIAQVALGSPVGGGRSTINMQGALRTSVVWQSVVDEPLAGDIVISPTDGRTGHVGILGDGGRIYSNSSTQRGWRQNYTVENWRHRFHDQLQLDVLIYRHH